VIVNTK